VRVGDEHKRRAHILHCKLSSTFQGAQEYLP
jgi:hypothetical protein